MDSGEGGTAEELGKEGVGDLTCSSCDANIEDFVAHCFGMT